MDWQKIYNDRKVGSPQEAAKVIKSGDHVVVGYAAAEPTSVLRAICDRYHKKQRRGNRHSAEIRIFHFDGACYFA